MTALPSRTQRQRRVEQLQLAALCRAARRSAAARASSSASQRRGARLPAALVISDLRGSPLPVRKTLARALSIRARLRPPRRKRGSDLLPTLLMSPSEPEASTSRSPRQIGLWRAPPASCCSGHSSRLASAVESERRAIDRLRVDEAAVVVVEVAAGRAASSQSRCAARPPAARRNCPRRQSRWPIAAPRQAATRRLRRSPRSAPRRRPPRSSAARCWSSRMSKPGGTPASSGKRCSSRSQKAWMVCTLRPPGVSMARANSRRARCISSDDRGAGRAALRARLAGRRRRRVTHSARRSNTRFDISAAAALV